MAKSLQLMCLCSEGHNALSRCSQFGWINLQSSGIDMDLYEWNCTIITIVNNIIYKKILFLFYS